jgi:hypothetical protein
MENEVKRFPEARADRLHIFLGRLLYFLAGLVTGLLFCKC